MGNNVIHLCFKCGNEMILDEDARKLGFYQYLCISTQCLGKMCSELEKIEKIKVGHDNTPA